MRPWIKLTIGLSLLAATWLVVLPMLSRWQPVRDHIDRMQAAEIQVDAMFYSELNYVPGL